MENDKNKIDAYNLLRAELEKNILAKVQLIKDKVLTYTAPTVGENIHMLTLVNEELDDVLLNWDLDGIPGVNSMDFESDEDADY